MPSAQAQLTAPVQPDPAFNIEVAAPAVPARSLRLRTLEHEVISLFVQISGILGMPRSVGEIYGLLFISQQPLPMDEIMGRLGISKGSASQGLKFLRGAGAVQPVLVPSDRRMHYEAVAELRNLVTRFLQHRFIPHLDTGLARLGRITELTKTLPPDERRYVQGRLKLLQSWERNGRRVLPILAKIIGK
jgi:DNA-binding transcriptional regulator GbsR (MarR family)